VVNTNYPKRKKILKHEDTNSRKCGCPVRLHDYLDKVTNEWWLTIHNGVGNHKMKPKMERHLLACRLRQNDNKVVPDLTKSLV